MTLHLPSAPAIPLEGGFYAGRILIAGTAYALIVAPKAEGERANSIWARSQKMVAGAVSYCDGLANTHAMAEAGSALAKWALGLRIGGFDDWYIPSLDELEICYRHLKPGTVQNSLYSRSGINVSAIPSTYPYSAAAPLQTENELFRAGGSEAFSEATYWSSTQRESNSDSAWSQTFRYGGQLSWGKGIISRARAVRRLAI